jgi:uncharacterized protein (DUF433 family)
MITHTNISFDPDVCQGRPVITGTGIRTEIVFSRFKAGESIPELAADYFVRCSHIEDAIRYEITK